MPAADVLIVAGLHVPVMPLIDVDGNVGAVPCWQSGPIVLNVGDCSVVITMFMVVTEPHCPAFGVKV